MLVGMEWECFCAIGTAGALVFRGIGREIESAGAFESFLHRQIRCKQKPWFREKSGLLWFLGFEYVVVLRKIKPMGLGTLRGHTPTYNIQQITTIAQRNRAQ